VKHQNEQLTEIQVDQFGRNSIALLSEGAQVLPAKIKERLYAARMKALSVRKAEKYLFRNRFWLASLAIGALDLMAAGRVLAG